MLKNIPLSCNSFLAVPCPSLSLILRSFNLYQNACLSCIQAGFKSSYENATSGSIVQCSNLHARQRVGSCDVKHDSRSGGCEFNLPNYLCLCRWSHFTRQIYSCMLSLATHRYWALSKLYHIRSTTNPPSEIATTIHCLYIYIYIYIGFIRWLSSIP